MKTKLVCCQKEQSKEVCCRISGNDDYRKLNKRYYLNG